MALVRQPARSGGVGWERTIVGAMPSIKAVIDSGGKGLGLEGISFVEGVFGVEIPSLILQDAKPIDGTEQPVVCPMSCVR